MSSDATIQRLEEDSRGASSNEVWLPRPLTGTVEGSSSEAPGRQQLSLRRRQAQCRDGEEQVSALEAPDPWSQYTEFNEPPSSCTSETTTDDEDEHFQVVEVAQRISPMNILLDCLFPMVFAAAILGLLHCAGLIAPAKNSSCACRSGEGTTISRMVPCEMWQDVRSVLSFLLGAIVCCIVTRERKLTEGHGKVQLYSCLL